MTETRQPYSQKRIASRVIWSQVCVVMKSTESGVCMARYFLSEVKSPLTLASLEEQD